MDKYNKLWGSIIGGVLGLIVAKFALPPELASPAVVDPLVTLLGAWFGTWVAPKNAPTK